MASIDETYGGPKYGQHPLDDQVSREVWKQALEYGLLRRLDGLVFVFTGTMSMPRGELAAMVTALGGHHTNAVPGAGMNYVLVHAEGARSGRKMQAAVNGGKTVMSESEFVRALVPSPDELDDGQADPFRLHQLLEASGWK